MRADTSLALLAAPAARASPPGEEAARSHRLDTESAGLVLSKTTLGRTPGSAVR